MTASKNVELSIEKEPIEKKEKFVTEYLEKNAESNTAAAILAMDSLSKDAELRANYLLLLITDNKGYDPVSAYGTNYYLIDYGSKNIGHLLEGDKFVLFERKDISDNLPYLKIQKVGTKKIAEAHPLPGRNNAFRKELQKEYLRLIRE